MHQLLTAMALLGSTVIDTVAAQECGSICTDVCFSAVDKCLAQPDLNQDICREQFDKCSDFCFIHPCAKPKVSEDGLYVILAADETSTTRTVNACIDHCEPVLATCLEIPELTSQGPQLCQQQDTLCHTFCNQYPQAYLFLNDDSSEITFPVAGHDGVCLDTCDTTLETCSANANTFRDLYMCKYEHLKCLTACHTPDTRIIERRGEHACGDLCEPMLNGCITVEQNAPRHGVDFCFEQDRFCHLYCETFPDPGPEPVNTREAGRCEEAYKHCIAGGNVAGRCRHELRICSGGRHATVPDNDVVNKRSAGVCIDKCEPTLAACIRTNDLTTQGPQFCYQQNAVCSIYCAQHFHAELELNEAGNEIVFPPPSAFGGSNACWEASEAQFSICSAAAEIVHSDLYNCKYERVLSLAMCYEAGSSEAEATTVADEVEACQDKYQTCIATPWSIANGVGRCKNNLHACLGSIGTVLSGRSKTAPAVISRQVDPCRAHCGAEFTSCLAEGNGAGRCKHSQRICLSSCPPFSAVIKSGSHVCADACPEILGKCKANPPIDASSVFCDNQSTNCEAFCKEFKLHHPRTVDNGTVIIFPPTFTPPIATEATDNVATIIVTAGTGPTVAPPVIASSAYQSIFPTAVPVKRQSQSCRDFCGEACRVQREVCEKANLEGCGSQAQDCLGRCYGTWCPIFGWK